MITGNSFSCVLGNHGFQLISGGNALGLKHPGATPRFLSLLGLKRTKNELFLL